MALSVEITSYLYDLKKLVYNSAIPSIPHPFKISISAMDFFIIGLAERLVLDNTTKTNDTNVASAWSNFQSSKSLLNSVELQVRAAEIANDGITAEYESGLGRTTLEVIQSNSFLLSAQISLADSERNYLLSQFNLLKSIGLLNSNYLKIK